FERFRATRHAPRCACGGLLKPATISFGQSLRARDLERAFAAAGAADLVLALGSTLSVHPAASVPLLAAGHGAQYVIVHRGTTVIRRSRCVWMAMSRRSCLLLSAWRVQEVRTDSAPEFTVISSQSSVWYRVFSIQVWPYELATNLRETAP